MEKCISVPHDRKTIFCFPSHEKKIFWLRKVLKFFYEHNENLNIRCFSIVYVDTTTGILSVLTPWKRGKFRNGNIIIIALQ
jgi:hypothetical protein